MVEFKARNRIQYYLKPPKNPEYMRIALDWMNRIRREDLPDIKAVDYHDLLKVYEIQSILLVGEMMGRASLFREESRWGYHHWRVDIPEKKPEWEQTWVIVRKGTDGMDLIKLVRDKNKSIPIIIITGYGSEKNKRLAENYGVSKILSKPCSILDITLAIEQSLKAS